LRDVADRDEGQLPQREQRDELARRGVGELPNPEERALALVFVVAAAVEGRGGVAGLQGGDELVDFGAYLGGLR